MSVRNTYFEQVPLEVVRKIAIELDLQGEKISSAKRPRAIVRRRRLVPKRSRRTRKD